MRRTNQIDHLYFNCSFSSAVRHKLVSRLHCEDMPEEWSSVATWYNGLKIWKSRNNAIFQERKSEDLQVVKLFSVVYITDLRKA